MKEIELFYDYASPWAYLAEQMAPRVFEGIPLVRRPTFLRAFDAFSTGIPYAGAKLQYIARDFARCAAHEGVTFRPPSNFPINGVHALRGALIAEKIGKFTPYHEAMFHAAWRDDRDVSKKNVVRDVAREAGVPEVDGELDSPWVKDELRARSEKALALGLFGVPSFVVGGELFWGHDRMDYAKRAARAE